MTRCVFLIGLTALLVAPALPAAAQEKYDNTWRHPVIAIPKLAVAPTIDGKIDPAEWKNATLFPAPISRDPLSGDGVPARERSWIYLAYDDNNLYWAMRQDLPPYELPVKAESTTRDVGEGRDNTINILFSTSTDRPEQFNFSSNANGTLYDRRFDDGTNNYYNPDVTCKASKDDRGWEAEVVIPFKEINVAAVPADGTEWNCYFYSAWRNSGTRMFAWPYVRWRNKNETGRIVFAGNVPGVRFESDGKVSVSGPGAEAASVKTRMLHRPRGTGESNYFPALMSAMDVSQGEGATFEAMDKIVERILAPYQEVSNAEGVGEYLLRYDVTAGDKPLARGVQSFQISPPIDLTLTPYYLQKKKLGVVAQSIMDNAHSATFEVQPNGPKVDAPYQAGRAAVLIDSEKIPVGTYTLKAVTRDAAGKVINEVEQSFDKPKEPNWWTMDYGREPVIPEPWVPIHADSSKATVLLRTYSFTDEALPSAIHARGEDILAGPITLETSAAWDEKKVTLAAEEREAVTYRGTMRKGDVHVAVSNRMEFDGYMIVDVDLTGKGKLDKLEMVIPFKADQATLMQNYCPTAGPGYGTQGRFHGYVPDSYTAPPMLTHWMGNDDRGLELCFESSKGWSIAKTKEAMRVTRNGDRVELRVGFITKPIELSDTPRRIRFGLVATPTKTLIPTLQRARFYDDIAVALLPFDWAGFPAWHPPIKEGERKDKTAQWVKDVHAERQKLLVNGGWAVSVQDPDNAPWIYEMFAAPLSNVSYSSAKQYAYCYNSPYSRFLSTSFAYNADILKFDGIRFDTVTPGYLCDSEVHGCGWKDDNGQPWPTFSVFAQRECWKRIYRAFHGGVQWGGVVYTPNAAGPIMAVHSFSDHHEIGEGFYQHAATLKEGYTTGMIRSMMAGNQYGFVTGSNLKDGPLYFNERIAALLPNNAEPRFLDSRGWRPDYAAHGNPAASIFDAWVWVDRYNARFMGWWQNSDVLSIDKGENELYGSMWVQPGRRVLLVVTNYEKKPLPQLAVKLDLAKLGFDRKVYAEDAITFEPLVVADDGTIKLDVFGQRYRLVQISSDKPRYRDEVLSPNLLTSAPESVNETWKTAIKLEPHSVYVMSADVKIDDYIGAKSASPNVMGRFSPAVSHYVQLGVSGSDIFGICGGYRIAGSKPYDTTDLHLRSYRPQWWEPTGGYVRMFSPIRTGANPAATECFLGLTDKGEAQVKNIQLRKVLN